MVPTIPAPGEDCAGIARPRERHRCRAPRAGQTIGLPGGPGRPIALAATEIASGHSATVMAAKSGTPNALIATGLTFSDQPMVALP